MAEYKDVAPLKTQIAHIKKTVNSLNTDYMTGYLSALSVTGGIIAGLPTADVVEQIEGEWLDGFSRQTCSICKYRGYKAYKYCPNCGAKMKGGERE